MTSNEGIEQRLSDILNWLKNVLSPAIPKGQWVFIDQAKGAVIEMELPKKSIAPGEDKDIISFGTERGTLIGLQSTFTGSRDLTLTLETGPSTVFVGIASEMSRDGFDKENRLMWWLAQRTLAEPEGYIVSAVFNPDEPIPYSGLKYRVANNNKGAETLVHVDGIIRKVVDKK